MELANRDDELLLIQGPLAVLGLSAAYAATLGVLERKYPIKPDHIWAEVTGGVMLSLVPVALSARRILKRNPDLPWQTYEGAIWRAFLASGAPIVLWQLGEAVLRHVELLRYTAPRSLRRWSEELDTDSLGAGLYDADQDR